MSSYIKKVNKQRCATVCIILNIRLIFNHYYRYYKFIQQVPNGR